MEPPSRESASSFCTQAQAPGIALSGRSSLPPDPGRLDRQAARAPAEIGLEIGEVGRTVLGHLGADPGVARTDPPRERSDRFPREAIFGKRVRMSLAEGLGGELLAPVVV